jgi:hypothetical protein
MPKRPQYCQGCAEEVPYEDFCFKCAMCKPMHCCCVRETKASHVLYACVLLGFFLGAMFVSAFMGAP